jgi:NTP pyrophosphatase (non-canonical NTP hydrolase)
MTLTEYSELSSLTANKAENIIKLYLESQRWEIDLDHAVRGITTESGEIADILKKRFIYGKEIDQIHTKEELGDLLWYIALAIKSLGCTFEEIMKMNIDKLRTRYPNLYTKADALNRNLDVERKTLENS